MENSSVPGQRAQFRARNEIVQKIVQKGGQTLDSEFGAL
jgi:hypothetical protein